MRYRIKHYKFYYRFKLHHQRLYRAAYSSLILLALLVIGFGVSQYFKPNYQLSKGAASLVGTPDYPLVKNQLSYNSKTQTYMLNKGGINNSKASANSVSIGSNQNAFSLSIPTKLNKGVTFYDDHTGLSFTLAPQFSANAGKNSSGRLVYPLGRGNVQAVYTIKQNGLKEDMVINKSIGDNASFSYELKLPSDLQARMMPSGAVGIYSASPSLFGHISYGSSSDQSLVNKAKQNAAKNNLVFALAPPTVYDGSGDNSVGSAKLSLKGDMLTMSASALKNLQYPITIDPSVIVASASSFGQTGNNEGGISLSSFSNQISEAGLDGGVIATSWSTTTVLPAARSLMSTVVNNGYIYLIGGSTTSITATVIYSQINSNGTIGSWNTTTSLPSATVYSSAVAYNGYVYEIGGSVGGSPVTTVDYAKFNSNGTIGSWTATSTLPLIRADASAAAYNGYIYEIGGFNNSGSVNTVYYAPVNADGTLGSWNTTTVLPSATQYQTSVEYNGYLYLIGGFSGGSTQTVDYAPINPNGTLGSWAATASLPTGVQAGSSAVYNGYIYEFGGYNVGSGNTVNTAYYAPIYANGSLGTWQSLTNLSANTQDESSVAYNGVIYVIGGDNGVSNSTTVNYAAIRPAGYLSTAVATTGLPTATYEATSAVYNGYIYELAGATSSGSWSTTVDYAPISSSGTIGAWTATTSLPTSLDLSTTEVYNGYIYELGGSANGAATAVVNYAPISSSGTIGAWTATTSLSTAVYGETSAVYNGYMYILGGVGSSQQSTVYYSAIATAGTLGTWTATTSLPTTYVYSTTVINGGYIYEIGGSAAGSATTAVYYAPINSSGTIGSWTSTANLPAANYQASAVTCNGYVYYLGGRTTSSVDYAPINSNGTLGSWTATTSLVQSTLYGSANCYSGYVYEVGGSSGTLSPYTTVDSFQVNNGGPGTIGSWGTATALPVANWRGMSVAYNGYIYDIGGETTSMTFTNAVYYAPINANGTIGSWTATTSLLSTADLVTASAYNGYLYVAGEYAPINANGTIGAWATTTTGGLTQVIYNGYMYSVGNGFATTVSYAKINSNGSVGSSTTTTSLPVGANDASALAYDGYMYEIGGNVSGTITSAVYYAPINANGTIGSWTATTRLLAPTADATAVSENGYVYLLSGLGGASGATEYAPINANGTLGSWTYTTTLSSGTYFAASALYNGYVYELGGITGITTVNYADLNSIPHIGSYSVLLDLSGLSTADPEPTYLVAYGTDTGNLDIASSAGTGGTSTYYSYGTNACPTFNPESQLNYGIGPTLAGVNPVGLTANGCSASTNMARYEYLRYILDDSQTATFPDVNSNHSSITRIQAYFIASPVNRLRGGMTLSNGVNSGLDAQP
ncbi:MAG: hypothetical protein WDN66_05495 [Candidatus Saccharibacteria bacterium]